MRTRSLLIGLLLTAVGSVTISALPADAVAKPTVRAISIKNGSTAGGTVVTITGTNFTRVSAVKFGTSAGGRLSVKSRTKLTISSPKHAAGRLNIRITAAAGTSSIVKADEFLYVTRPTVTAVSPASSSTAGGKVLTITGTNFVGVTAVTFGNGSANKGTKVTVKSAKKLTVTTPKHAIGWVNVRVTAAGGTSPNATANQIRYGTTPTITTFSPTEGTSTGPERTWITVTGKGMDEIDNVLVDGQHAPFGSDDSTHLHFYAPLHLAGSVVIQLVAPGGTVSTTFLYVDPPTVTSSTPASGPTTGGTIVTINGTHLIGATVGIGSKPVPFTQDPATGQITITMPPYPARGVPIVITNSGGFAIANFRYVEAP